MGPFTLLHAKPIMVMNSVYVCLFLCVLNKVADFHKLRSEVLCHHHLHHCCRLRHHHDHHHHP